MTPSEANLWLITRSDQYYPCAGCRDWCHLSDQETIMDKWRDLKELPGGTWYLIRINDGSWSQVDTK